MASSYAATSAILNIPAAHHPRLRPMIEQLAGMSHVTFGDAMNLIEAVCIDAKITGLDIDMVQPGAQVAVPFAPSANASPGDQFDDGVRRHVHRLIQGGKS